MSIKPWTRTLPNHQKAGIQFRDISALDAVEQGGVEIFVIDLPDCGGSRRSGERGIGVTSLCSFEGD